MSEEKHLFRIESVWTGNSDGDGQLKGEGFTLSYGIPPQLGGKPGRASPEELLLAALASCYSATLAYLAERRKLPVTRIEIPVEGDVIRELGGTLRFAIIRLRPRLFVTSDSEAHHGALIECAHKAEQYCVVANALRDNVEITIDPEVIVHTQ
jgi:peroxiredoxin-like protein